MKEEKTIKTTLSSDIMDQIADLVESELKSKNVHFVREGTVFRVSQGDYNHLLLSQEVATVKLIKKGVITLDMIEKDIKSY